MAGGKFMLMLGVFGTLCIAANGMHEPVEIKITLPPPAEMISGAAEAVDYASDLIRQIPAEKQAVQPDAAGQMIYRIRDPYNAPGSQLGAYYDYETAVAMCPGGYCIFDQNGSLLYTG
ncbi:MAG: hypothetical protein J5722_03105 [Oscillospiraceae bacterium]|nr:hypothetical protein [Oscillospiraceae bacterium]